MHVLQKPVFTQLLSAIMVAASPLQPAASPLLAIDPAAAALDALAQLQQYAYATLEQSDDLAKRASGGCSLATATVRKDWQVAYI